MPTARQHHASAVVNGVVYVIGGQNSSGVRTTVEAYDPVINSWTARASMPTGRTGAAAGVINGIIYVVGGLNGGVLNTVEAYNPVTNTWTTRAAMPTARHGLGVGVVNGILYAVGGATGAGGTGYVGTVEAYDPATNSWTPKDPMPTPRQGFAGVGVVNGVLYAVGGFNGVPLRTVEAFDPNASGNGWTAKALMPTARYFPGVAAQNGVIYVAGGTGASGNLSVVEAYQPATNTWSTAPAVPTVRYGLTLDVVGGRLYATGGANSGNALSTVEALPVAVTAGVWTAKAAMPTSRLALDGAQVNGVFYAIGGYNQVGGFSLFASNEAYDPITNVWTTRAPMPTARYVFAATTANGIVYAIGGNSGGSILPTMEAYNPVTNAWSTRTPMPTPRSGLAAVAVNGIVYALGGGSVSGSLNSVEAYDPTTNAWSSRAPIPTARGSALAAVAVNGIIYAIGGTTNNVTHSAAVEAYDPVTNTWSSKAAMPTARSALVAIEVNGIIYAIGGYNGSRLSTVEAYDPVTNTWTTEAAMPTARSNLVASAVNGSIYVAGGLGVGGAVAANEAFTPFEAVASTKADFDGDGKSDVLWKHATTGQTLVWLMNGTSIASSGSPGTVGDPNWRVLGVGDFDADGKADVLWKHSLSGDVLVWLMNGTSISGAGSPATVGDPNWVVQGVGDFNGDGKADVLWKHATTGQTLVWLMNGTSIASTGSPGTAADLDWQVQGVGDFNGDGKDDVVWRHAASGTVLVWLMNGTTIAASGSPATVDPSWQIKGVGDFDGNGKDDIVWQNTSSGTVLVWLMNGASVASHGSPATVGSVWQFRGVGDYDGDGKADLLWQNTASGSLVVWLMNGTAFGATGSPATVADLGWLVQPPLSVAPTPATAPGAPTGVAAIAGDAQVAVSFAPPASNGGSAITSYTVTSSPGGITAFGSASPIVVSGLTNGAAYTFTVTATNAIGSGPASTPSAQVTPNAFTVPGAPTGVSAIAGNAQATVSFSAPASNGGSPITGYTVISNPSGGVDTGAGSTGLSHLIVGLTNGVAYTFTVIATNAVGTSIPSTASNSVTPATVPGAPTAVLASAGNAQATVSFTAPASNGGSAVISYTVTSSPGGITGSGAASPIVMSGLTNGVAYTFTVTASNAIGSGPASTPSAQVTPNAFTVPGAPTGASAIAGNAQATVSFSAPASNGGSPIVGYTVTSNPGGLTVSGSASPIVVSGLTNGTAYTFTVTAVNAVGTSAPSTPSNSVTPGAVVTPSDAVADFSSSNPSGAWSYGYGANGSSFTPYGTYSASGCSGYTGPCWNTGNAYVPWVGSNPTGNTINYGTVVFPTDVLSLHPGPTEDSIVRWTAPAAGTYGISGLFEVIDVNPTGVIASIFRNSAQIFTIALSTPGALSAPFSLIESLSAGDTISFGVNGNGDYTYDSTGLKAVIGLVANAVTTTTVSSSANPSRQGQSVTFTATISGSSPTGTVQFRVGGADLGSLVAVTGGQAQLVTSALSVGSHSIGAAYSGDVSNSASNAAPINQQVRPAAYSDFDGDGKSDVLWKYTDGTLLEWLMNGITIAGTGSPAGVGDAGWKVLGIGDFDGDRKADVLWQNTLSGTVHVWLMNGTTIASSGSAATMSDPTWQVAGIGDFDGDSKADVLWKNSATGAVLLWLMNGTSIASTGTVATVSDTGWVVLGVGDFDGDGKADVLWKHTDGTVLMWQMNGMNIISSGSPATVSDVGWIVQGVGDFDGDGKADVLWRHTDGTLLVWQMNGSNIATTGSPATVSDPNWQVQVLGDYDGDGKADVFWRNSLSGTTYTWLMNGMSIASVGSPATVSDTRWTIVGVAGKSPSGATTQQITGATGGTIAAPGGSGVTIPAGAFPSDMMVTVSNVDSHPKLVPGMPAIQVNTASPVALSVPAIVRIAYTNEFLERWGFEDPTKLSVMTLNETTRLWEELPSSVDVVNKVVTANTPHFSLFALAYKYVPSVLPVCVLCLIQDSQLIPIQFFGGNDGKFFVPDPMASCEGTQRNVILIHGLADSIASFGGDSGLIRYARSKYENVIFYNYPSGIDIELNAQVLAQHIANSGLIPRGARFDIIAHSQGTLVARSMIEKYSSGLQGRGVDNLITLGGVHNGADPDAWLTLVLAMAFTVEEFANFLARKAGVFNRYKNLFPGLSQLTPGSHFLDQLNLAPNPGATRYYTVAGFVGTTAGDRISPFYSGRYGTSGVPFDGLVPTPSALGIETPAFNSVLSGSVTINGANHNQLHSNMLASGGAASQIDSWLQTNYQVFTTIVTGQDTVAPGSAPMQFVAEAFNPGNPIPVGSWPSSLAFNWTSSNPSVAQVDPGTGIVTPLQGGETCISATPINVQNSPEARAKARGGRNVVVASTPSGTTGILTRDDTNLCPDSDPNLGPPINDAHCVLVPNGNSSPSLSAVRGGASSSVQFNSDGSASVSGMSTSLTGSIARPRADANVRVAHSFRVFSDTLPVGTPVPITFQFGQSGSLLGQISDPDICSPAGAQLVFFFELSFQHLNTGRASVQLNPSVSVNGCGNPFTGFARLDSNTITFGLSNNAPIVLSRPGIAYSTPPGTTAQVDVSPIAVSLLVPVGEQFRIYYDAYVNSKTGGGQALGAATYSVAPIQFGALPEGVSLQRR